MYLQKNTLGECIDSQPRPSGVVRRIRRSWTPDGVAMAPYSSNSRENVASSSIAITVNTPWAPTSNGGLSGVCTDSPVACSNALLISRPLDTRRYPVRDVLPGLLR